MIRQLPTPISLPSVFSDDGSTEISGSLVASTVTQKLEHGYHCAVVLADLDDPESIIEHPIDIAAQSLGVDVVQDLLVLIEDEVKRG